MEFHQRALELLGDPHLLLDRARGLAATRLAASAGVALPEAVAEWYCVPTASAVWRAFSRYDESMIRCEGDDPARWWFGRPAERGESATTPWAMPPICHDPRGWIPGPILPLMGECVGTWWWGVVLTGAADPPVVITNNEGETWAWGGPSFSGYVYAVLFDASLAAPSGCGRHVWLEGYHLHGADRHRLREEFRAAPTTRVPYSHYSELTERFAREGQRVSTCNLNVPAGYGHRGDSEWWLWAATEVEFGDLVGRLSAVVPAMTGLAPGKNCLRVVAPSSPAAGDAGLESGESEIPF